MSLSRARDRVANDNAYANAYEKSDSNDSNNVTHYRLSNTGAFLCSIDTSVAHIVSISNIAKLLLTHRDQ